MPTRLLTLLRRHAIALLALFIALGGSSYAAVSAHNSRPSKNVLLGCVGKNTGTLRIVDSHIRCGSLETAVSFNREGQKGKRGPQGKRGPGGHDGASGAQGDAGAAGKDGLNGAAGTTGAKGDSGNEGAPGAKGDSGNDGAPGAKGDTGDDGAPGAKGDTGETGADGAPGATGAKGDTGAAGAKGDTGAAGSDGQSVTSVGENPGVNCPNGGVKYTSVSGVDYVCDGATDTAAEALTKLKTVDGSGSGLDADVLDGIDSTQLVQLGHFDGLFNSRFTTAFGPAFDTSIGGLFGAPDDSVSINPGGAVDRYLAETFLTAASFPPPGTAFASGQELSIQQNSALFSLLGVTYGGDGTTSFRLPDLRKQAPKGLHYVIVMTGLFPSRP